jgi:lambda repressor-like predicted transcriptional regulator
MPNNLPEKEKLPRLKVRASMFRRGWTLDDLAKKAGLVKGTVKNVFSGINQTPQTLEKLRQAAGVPNLATQTEK